MMESVPWVGDVLHSGSGAGRDLILPNKNKFDGF